MKDTIEKIIDAGNHAPSGDNCQPWRFEANNKQIFVYLIPERDTSLYSWGNRASLIANGAVIENMIVSANELGYSAAVELQPNKEQPELLAVLNIEPSQKTSNGLYQSIFKRTTNRKIYKSLLLDEETIEDLKSSSGEIDGIKILITSDEVHKKILGEIASANEKILFDNYYMHKFFFDHINWSSNEELKNRTGFYVKTLEIPGPALPGFKLAKNWFVMKSLNKIFGFGNLIAKQNAKVYSSASVMGAIIIKNKTEKDYLLAGQVFERLWLKVTSKNLSLQPLTGIYFLMQRVIGKEDGNLTPKQIGIIKSAYKKAFEIFKLDQETIVLTFRIGDGGQPSARTLRLPVNIQWIK
jgi:hypothetical protein